MPDMPLGDRMKEYERCAEQHLPQRLPVIIRVDGRHFSTYTRRIDLDEPFDNLFRDVMARVARRMCNEIQGAKLAYTQSDEISILVTSNDRIESMAWFGNDLQKLASVSASFATANFFQVAPRKWLTYGPHFDGRAFVIPPDEVCNYFLWRQRDWERNSLQMLARHYYSQSQLQGKNRSEMHDMIWEAGDNWNDLPAYHKRGVAVVQKEVSDPFVNDGKASSVWTIDKKPPRFGADRGYINGTFKWDGREEEE